MVKRGPTGNSKPLQKRHGSTQEEKMRRHKNKLRIWKRYMQKLSDTSKKPEAE